MKAPSFLVVAPAVSFLIVPLTLCGCQHTMAPPLPKALAAPAIVSYPIEDFNSDVARYRQAISGKDYATARTLRDAIVGRAFSSIEYGYSRFEGQIIERRASFETSADVTSLGVTAAATVIGAGDIKDILVASLSGIQGVRLSIDKNFFEQKTSETIVSQMRTDRATLEARILTNLATEDVIATVDPATKRMIPAYGLDDAWRDIVRYYYAGTVPSALISLNTATGKSAQDAEQNLQSTLSAINPATPAQAKQALNIGHAYFKLRDTALGSDSKAAQNAQSKIRSILIAVGSSPNDGASAQQLVDALKAAMSDAEDHPEKLPALASAIAAQDIQ